ncbi:hypothetical protein [Microbacterium caowuchunii]|uniref:Uncharacterized protein n=1 Tax=Microbacterium caowuchunii TaxID=2614638 RepID=A0A5N0T8B5_9MICO|nr:hypothetical protein [Microbacterium caowuchunii]KAA9131162.1 hypothetical protein F6B40_12745 [Microbacterium caowuchunii]
MRTEYAREIGAFRTSDHNPQPQHAAASGSVEGTNVSLGTPSASQRAQARVNAAQGVKLGEPPRVLKGTAVVAVHLEGKRVRVPADWAVAFSSARRRDALLLREPCGTLHVVVVSDTDGLLHSLDGLPEDLVRDLVRRHFPRSAR